MKGQLADVENERESLQELMRETMEPKDTVWFKLQASNYFLLTEIYSRDLTGKEGQDP